ncbi:MAG: COR domain-containing protein, partial [Cyanobacteria bacterium J06648_11]
RPLQYWIDLLLQACPGAPRVAIVCSHSTAPSEELHRRIDEELREEHREIPRFFVDSIDEAGELDELQKWIDQSVGEVVATQGTAVPAYWEVAQDLVASWLRADRDQGQAGLIRDLSFEEFQGQLQEAIVETAEGEDSRRFARMQEAVRSGRFKLTEDRVVRVLEFLTHSGWVYWDRSLFERRVIVGQQWALDGIYAVLDRRDEGQDATTYRQLQASRGRFTQHEIAEWGWNARGYTQAQQELLLSFMLRVGSCFELVGGEESLWGRTVYCAFEHLRSAEEEAADRRLDAIKSPAFEENLTSDSMHVAHWRQLMRQLGERFGVDGAYASDGFGVVDASGQAIRVALEAGKESGFGGIVTVQVAGSRAEEWRDWVVGVVRTTIPGIPGLGREDAGGDGSPVEHPAGSAARLAPSADSETGVQTLFISYAWNPGPDEAALVAPADQVDVEAPVQRICDALDGDPRVRYIRD